MWLDNSASIGPTTARNVVKSLGEARVLVF
jgi:hypothetical protein